MKMLIVLNAGETFTNSDVLGFFVLVVFLLAVGIVFGLKLSEDMGLAEQEPPPKKLPPAKSEDDELLSYIKKMLNESK